MSNQPPNSLKQEILDNAADRVAEIISKERRVEELLRLYPDHPEQEKEENRKAVLHQVPELEYFFELIFRPRSWRRPSQRRLCEAHAPPPWSTGALEDAAVMLRGHKWPIR